MKTLDDLRRGRKEAAAKMKAAADKLTGLESAEAPDAAAIAAAQGEFDAAKAEFALCDQQVKRAEETEAAEAAAAGTGDAGAAALPPATRPAVAADPALKGIEVGFAFHALAGAKGDKDKAIARLEKDGHSGISAALSGATEAAGGVTLPRPLAAQVIELLRPRVVMRRAGVRAFPMPAGQIRHARQSGAATAAYGAENSAIAASEPTFGKLDQTFKKLGALVPIGNSLLRHSSVDMAMMARDDLLEVMSLREDLGFLRNDGSGDLPKGVVSWCLVGNLQSAVANTVSVVDLALRKAINKVETANVGMTNCGWVLRPDVKNFLASLRDANNFLLYPSIETAGTLKGYPIYTTTQLPDNLGVGTNESEIVFCAFDQMMIGDSMTLSLAVSSEASYVDGGGNTVSAFQRDLTLMRAISEHDFAPRQDAGIAVIRGVAWTI